MLRLRRRHRRLADVIPPAKHPITVGNRLCEEVMVVGRERSSIFFCSRRRKKRFTFFFSWILTSPSLSLSLSTSFCLCLFLSPSTDLKCPCAGDSSDVLCDASLPLPLSLLFFFSFLDDPFSTSFSRQLPSGGRRLHCSNDERRIPCHFPDSDRPFATILFQDLKVADIRFQFVQH